MVDTLEILGPRVLKETPVCLDPRESPDTVELPELVFPDSQERMVALDSTEWKEERERLVCLDLVVLPETHSMDCPAHPVPVDPWDLRVTMDATGRPVCPVCLD